MCSIFSVSFKRVSVIMMFLTSCNCLLASFGASCSTVKFHPLGVLSNGMTLPVSILHANARSGPKQTRCPCCVMGLTAIRALLICACRDSLVISICGHKQTSTFSPYNRLAFCRVRHSSIRVPMTSATSCCRMPCRQHCPARCPVVSKRDAPAPFV